MLGPFNSDKYILIDQRHAERMGIEIQLVLWKIHVFQWKITA